MSRRTAGSLGKLIEANDFQSQIRQTANCSY